jgi:hypothetical protein
MPFVSIDFALVMMLSWAATLMMMLYDQLALVLLQPLATFP